MKVVLLTSEAVKVTPLNSAGTHTPTVAEITTAPFLEIDEQQYPLSVQVSAVLD